VVLVNILPTYYVVLFLASGLALAEHTFSGRMLAWQLVTHLTMTHNFFRTTVLALDGPFWSLALESQLYALFPLLLFGFRRLNPTVTLMIVLGCQTAFRLIILSLGTGYSDTTFTLPWSVLGRLFEFTLGMWAATLVAKAPIMKARLSALLSLAAFFAATSSKGHFGVTHPLTDLLWSVGFFCLFLSSAQSHSWIQRALCWRPLVALGIISYSVYLTHDLVLGSCMSALIAVTQHKVSVLVLAPFALGLTILVGYVCYVWVERPAIALFRGRVMLRSLGRDTR
jgi:peptidoglycan/LPS O-acetylase OafA/YrhL